MTQASEDRLREIFFSTGDSSICHQVSVSRFYSAKDTIVQTIFMARRLSRGWSSGPVLDSTLLDFILMLKQT